MNTSKRRFCFRFHDDGSRAQERRAGAHVSVACRPALTYGSSLSLDVSTTPCAIIGERGRCPPMSMGDDERLTAEEDGIRDFVITGSGPARACAGATGCRMDIRRSRSAESGHMGSPDALFGCLALKGVSLEGGTKVISALSSSRATRASRGSPCPTGSRRSTQGHSTASRSSTRAGAPSPSRRGTSPDMCSSEREGSSSSARDPPAPPGPTFNKQGLPPVFRFTITSCSVRCTPSAPGNPLNRPAKIDIYAPRDGCGCECMMPAGCLENITHPFSHFQRREDSREEAFSVHPVTSEVEPSRSAKA